MSHTLFVAGRYNKYSRTISQTPWFVDGDKKVADSVEGFIIDALKRLLPHQHAKFIASGREDVDVRMLGRGRPFALEILKPDDPEPGEALMRKIEAEVASLSGGKVTVRDVQVVKKRDVTQNLKDEGTEKRKKYRALCCCSRPLSPQAMDTINQQFRQTTLQQQTPIRVLHRRPLATRLRTIFELQLQPVQSSGRMFTLVLVVESGTYIKEFVHSDFGRTTPSLSSVIGGDCSTDIIALDVDEVFVEWPPSLSAPTDPSHDKDEVQIK